jgi:hypothetical protein
MSAECRLSLPRGVDYLGLRCHVELDRGPIRWKVLPKISAIVEILLDVHVYFNKH